MDNTSLAVRDVGATLISSNHRRPRSTRLGPSRPAHTPAAPNHQLTRRLGRAELISVGAPCLSRPSNPGRCARATNQLEADAGGAATSGLTAGDDNPASVAIGTAALSGKGIVHDRQAPDTISTAEAGPVVSGSTSECPPAERLVGQCRGAGRRRDRYTVRVCSSRRHTDPGRRGSRSTSSSATSWQRRPSRAPR